MNNSRSPQRIAIMQGRLLPPEAGRIQCFPRNQWRIEFERAAEAGLDAIEWIYDAYGEDLNPIATDEGISEIKQCSELHHIAVVSLCADYFMDVPLTRARGPELRNLVSRLYWLMERCRRTGVRRVVLPFVDASRIENAGDKDHVVSVLLDTLPAARQAGVELHIESALPPRELALLLDRLDDPLIKCNYDSGNSSSLGYDPVEEFSAYGSRIGSVHIKDRKLHGSTVSLGTGDANLEAVFEGLGQLGYSGDYVLQVARGETGGETDWARRNREYVAQRIRKPKGFAQEQAR